MTPCWDRGLLFGAYKVTMHCRGWGSSLYDHELSQGFKDDVDDPSVWVRFRHLPANHPLDEQLAGASFLAWTTTPWTLPANVALAVKPGASYALVEYTGEGETERLVLAEVLAVQVVSEANFTTLSTFQGDTMRGLRYEQLFKGVPAPGDSIDWAQAYHVEVYNFVS